MKTTLSKYIFLTILLLNISINIIGNDTLSYSLSFNYNRDLSDTYGKGDLFSGEFVISRAWYGASINYGHFQSHSIFIYKILVEEINKTIEIQFDEVSYMSCSSLSLLILPIQKKWIIVDLNIGIAFNKATSSRFNKVDYSYNLNEDKFTYLYKDYKLIKRNHFGYQAGFDVSIFITKKFGLQLNSRMQHLSNGGSFFFAGSGVCFRF
jgi:hypothetical protein